MTAERTKALWGFLERLFSPQPYTGEMHDVYDQIFPTEPYIFIDRQLFSDTPSIKLRVDPRADGNEETFGEDEWLYRLAVAYFLHCRHNAKRGISCGDSEKSEMKIRDSYLAERIVRAAYHIQVWGFTEKSVREYMDSSNPDPSFFIDVISRIGKKEYKNEVFQLIKSLEDSLTEEIFQKDYCAAKNDYIWKEEPPPKEKIIKNEARKKAHDQALTEKLIVYKNASDNYKKTLEDIYNIAASSSFRLIDSTGQYEYSWKAPKYKEGKGAIISLRIEVLQELPERELPNNLKDKIGTDEYKSWYKSYYSDCMETLLANKGINKSGSPWIELLSVTRNIGLQERVLSETQLKVVCLALGLRKEIYEKLKEIMEEAGMRTKRINHWKNVLGENKELDKQIIDASEEKLCDFLESAKARAKCVEDEVEKEIQELEKNNTNEKNDKNKEKEKNDIIKEIKQTIPRRILVNAAIDMRQIGLYPCIRLTKEDKISDSDRKMFDGFPTVEDWSEAKPSAKKSKQTVDM